MLSNKIDSIQKIVISDALTFMDRNDEKYSKYLNDLYYAKIIPNNNDNIQSKIILYDKNKQKIIESKYEIIGIYSNKTKIWIWAWSLPNYRKISLSIAKKILHYGLDIDFEHPKLELITSSFHINDNIQLDIQIAIALYLSKMPFLLKLKSTSIIASDTVEKFIDVEASNRDVDDYYIHYIVLLDKPN